MLARRLMLFSSVALLSFTGCVLKGEVGSKSDESNGTGASGGSSGAGASAGAGGSGSSAGGIGGVGGVKSTGGSGGSTSTGGAAGAAGAPQVPTTPNPPQGYAKCGSGTFDQTQAKQACESVWTDPQFGVLYDPTAHIPSDCSAITISGGQYEVWCDSASDKYYLWAKLDGIQQVSSLCSNIPPQLAGIQEFYDDYPGWHGGNGGSAYQASPFDTTQYVVLNESSASKNGTGRLWVGGWLRLGQQCDLDTLKTLTGFNFAWFEN